MQPESRSLLVSREAIRKRPDRIRAGTSDKHRGYPARFGEKSAESPAVKASARGTRLVLRPEHPAWHPRPRVRAARSEIPGSPEPRIAPIVRTNVSAFHRPQDIRTFALLCPRETNRTAQPRNSEPARFAL